MEAGRRAGKPVPGQGERDPLAQGAAAKGWELLSTKQATIDRFKRESDAAVTTLADTKTFKDAVGSAGDDTLVRAYVSGPQTMAAIRKAGGADAQKLVDTLGTLDWVRAELQATPDGVRLDTNVHGTPGKIFAGAITKGFEPKLPNRIPQDALLYYTFHGSGSVFGALGQESGARRARFPPVPRDLPAGRRPDGRGRRALRPPSGGRIPEITLVTEPKAGTDGASTVDRLLRQYRADLGVTPNHGTVAGLPARTLRFGQFALQYSNVDGRFVISTAPAGLAGAKSGGSSLSKSDTYQDAVDASGLPSKTQGFLYVDVSGGVGLAEKLSGSSFPSEVARNIKPLRSAMEYAVSHTHELQITLFLRIK